MVAVGRVGRPFGVRGWLHVHSDTEPGERLLEYRPWLLGGPGEWREVEVAESAARSDGLVVRLAGVTSREQAARLVGADIGVPRHVLPPPEPGEYYWCDLIGLTVVTASGQVLGEVTDLLETGANDVLVVHGERERLVPFVEEQVVRAVDLTAGRIEVDWDPEF